MKTNRKKYMKQYRANPVNKEKHNISSKKWAAKNIEKVSLYRKKWQEKNKGKYKEYYREYHKEWYQKNKEHYQEKAREYAKENREKMYEYRKKYGQDRRLKCIEHYGGKCACCGETEIDFLAIDHINGGGNEHRRKVGDVHGWLVKNNFPEGFQVLCHNCNLAKAFYGVCPHQRNK